MSRDFGRREKRSIPKACRFPIMNHTRSAVHVSVGARARVSLRARMCARARVRAYVGLRGHAKWEPRPAARLPTDGGGGGEVSRTQVGLIQM